MRRRTFLGVASVSLAGACGCPNVWSRTETVIQVPNDHQISNSSVVDLSGFISNSIRSGVTLNFGEGIFTLSQTLLIPKDVRNVSILGTGSRLRKSGGFPLIRMNGDRNTLHGVILQGECSADVQCDPNVKAGSLLLINGSFNNIKKSTFSNSLSNGVHLDGQKSRCEGNEVVLCSINNNARVGLAMARARSTKVSDCVISSAGFEALTLDLGTVSSVIERCVMRRSNRNGGIGTVGYDGCRDILISNNSFEESADTSKAHIRAGNAIGLSERIAITGNRFGGRNVAINLRGTKKSTGGTRAMQIYGNEFSASRSDSILFDSDDSNIEIGSNKFKD